LTKRLTKKKKKKGFPSPQDRKGRDKRKKEKGEEGSHLFGEGERPNCAAHLVFTSRERESDNALKVKGGGGRESGTFSERGEKKKKKGGKV